MSKENAKALESGEDAVMEAEAVPETNAEVPEYDEAGLRELVDQAAAEVQTGKEQILKEADQKLEPDPSLHIEVAEANATLEKGGFGERIRGIKERIVNLAQATRDKIMALTGSERADAQPTAASPKETIPAKKEGESALPETATEVAQVKAPIVEEAEPEPEQLDTMANEGAEREEPRFAEKITNLEAKAILVENSTAFHRDAQDLLVNLEKLIQERPRKVEKFKDGLTSQLTERVAARARADSLVGEISRLDAERERIDREAEEGRQALSRELNEQGFIRRMTNKGKISELERTVKQKRDEADRVWKQRNEDIREQNALRERLSNGDLSSSKSSDEINGAYFELRQLARSIEGQTTPDYSTLVKQVVDKTAEEHFNGERGEFTNEARQVFSELNKLRSELAFGRNMEDVSLGSARDLEEVRARARHNADEEFESELGKYTEDSFSAIARYQGKPVEQVKAEIKERLRKEAWEETYKNTYENLSGNFNASMYLIGLKESDLQEYISVAEQAHAKLGGSFDAEEFKKDFEYGRYRAYYEARRTGQNIFTHVTSGERAKEVIKQRALKASRITTPEELQNQYYKLKEMGQTSNIEENIYFTSGGGGYHYGTGFIDYANRIVKPRSKEDFAFFAATGNDILAAGKSIEPAAPSMREQHEANRGRAVGNYESVDGTELPIDELSIVVAQSEVPNYAALLKEQGYSEDYISQHLVGIPDEIVERALREGKDTVGTPHFMTDSRAIQGFVDGELKRMLVRQSRNRDKIFATVSGRTSKDPVSGYFGSQVFKWQQIN